MNKEEIKQLKDEFGIHFKNSPDEFVFLQRFIDDLRAKDKAELLKEIDDRIKLLANVFDIQDVNKILLPPNIKIAIRELEDVKKLL